LHYLVVVDRQLRDLGDMRAPARNSLAVAALAGLVFAVSLPLAATAAIVPHSVSFAVPDVTSGFTTWTVPAGVTSIRVTAVGGNGGGGPSSSGGRGDTVTADVAVVPGTALTVAVGSAGLSPSAGTPGGGAANPLSSGGGGGGWSGVRLADLTPLVVAGAGGGASFSLTTNGGDAGQPGSDGQFFRFGFGGGGGAGTASAGGAGGIAGLGGTGGTAGTLYQGGAGPNGAGGGGAGYYGGGGGAIYWSAGGGGGGSSYPASGAPGLISSALKAPADPADGSVTIAYDVQTFVVAFDSAGGSAVSALTVAEGDPATAPADPGRAGYTFGGWYTASSGGTAWNFGTAIAADGTLYARWIPTLAATGSDPTGPALSGGMIFLLGVAALLFSRRRRRTR